MKIIYFAAFSVILVSVFYVLPMEMSAATPSISSSQTTANVSTGTNDQSASTAATQANVSEVKATRTITVNSVPAVPITLTIGTCAITITNSPTPDVNCTDNTAAIATSTDTTASAIASRIRTITNLSDTGHGALTVGGSGTTASFTTTNTETSATVVTASLSSGSDITLTTVNTAGVVPVAQINTLTISGTVDTGDVFTATLPTVGAVTYTVLSSDTTTANIATGLNAAIQASSGYASQAFTSAASTNTVVFTAKVAGTGFTQTSSATNRSAVAQVVSFTPAEVSLSYKYSITINGTEYSFENKTGDDTARKVVEALRPLVDANPAVTCTENDVSVICTADVAGVAFTYATNVTKLTSPIGGRSTQRRIQQTTLTEQKPITTTSSVSSGFTRSLTKGFRGDDVALLQEILARDKNVYPSALVTGYFGPLTLDAVQKFQLKYNIVNSPNDEGYGFVGPKTRAKLTELQASGVTN